jgi:CRISPR-associated protein Cas1
MIKRTLYFGNPAYLSTQHEQLVIKKPELEEFTQIPIEDIGVVVLDHQQITISQALLSKLLANNVACITCDSFHHPTGLLLPLDGNTLQSQKFKTQINAGKPLIKNLWQQTIESKINNQAALLKRMGVEIGNMKRWSNEVQSGDATNREARAAVYYWKKIFKEFPDFTRDRNGFYPNNFLNYGYAILRAIVARNLVGSGLLPTLGIHHRNQYNAYCLADDIMEPYRPIVDEHVLSIMEKYPGKTELTTEIKKELLAIPTLDVIIEKQKSPLMIATQRTTASLSSCYAGELRNIRYPQLAVL